MQLSLNNFVRLCLQRALVGEIDTNMRAIAVNCNSQKVMIRVYSAQKLPSQIREDFDAGVVTQVVADFPDPEYGNPEISCEFVVLSEHIPLPEWGTLIFAHKVAL